MNGRHRAKRLGGALAILFGMLQGGTNLTAGTIRVSLAPAAEAHVEIFDDELRSPSAARAIAPEQETENCPVPRATEAVQSVAPQTTDSSLGVASVEPPAELLELPIERVLAAVYAAAALHGGPIGQALLAICPWNWNPVAEVDVLGVAPRASSAQPTCEAQRAPVVERRPNDRPKAKPAVAAGNWERMWGWPEIVREIDRAFEHRTPGVVHEGRCRWLVEGEAQREGENEVMRLAQRSDGLREHGVAPRDWQPRNSDEAASALAGLVRGTWLSTWGDELSTIRQRTAHEWVWNDRNPWVLNVRRGSGSAQGWPNGDVGAIDFELILDGPCRYLFLREEDPVLTSDRVADGSHDRMADEDEVADEGEADTEGDIAWEELTFDSGDGALPSLELDVQPRVARQASRGLDAMETAHLCEAPMQLFVGAIRQWVATTSAVAQLFGTIPNEIVTVATALRDAPWIEAAEANRLPIAPTHVEPAPLDERADATPAAPEPSSDPTDIDELDLGL